MANIAYKEQAVVELLLNSDKFNRDLRSAYQINSQLQARALTDSLKAQTLLDARMSKAFRTLKKLIGEADETAAEERKRTIANFQETARLGPIGYEPEDFDMPDVSTEHARQLAAMEANMTEFARRMNAMDIDVGQGRTLEADMEAAFGGDRAERLYGLSQLNQMTMDIERQRDILRDQIEEKEEYVEQLEEERQAHLDNSKILRQQGEIEAANSAARKAGHKKRKIKEQNKLLKAQNQELSDLNYRHEDIMDTKRKAENLDKSLYAIQQKQNNAERGFLREHKEKIRGLLEQKRKLLEMMRMQSQVWGEFAKQVDAITQAFKKTFVEAIAVSTAAVVAMKFKMDDLIGSFEAFEAEVINAQSIFQTSIDTLFSLSDEIVQFGVQYGISLDNAATGLYQLASAGLSAQESMEVLSNTLKLSMAVQGDHNTISKLTTQVIFGFGLQMSDSAFLTDKFAHAINKSLIEYQDLASAVKFAMPFFVSTNQNIDQLLGALQVLTNRALEAGIAGRGLRQALAEFAQHAEDNTAAFAKLGVKIVDASGNFRLLTDIAHDFKNALGPAASDVELMTTLLEDLNVRGATAFVHLVQNADEFQGAVEDLQNAAGSATEMAEIQQQSLLNQIQRVKNALIAPFLLSDEIGKANNTLNSFSLMLHKVVGMFEQMFVVVEDGVITGLTPLGEMVKELATSALVELAAVAQDVINAIKAMTDNGSDLMGLLKMITVPLRLTVKLLGWLGSEFIETLLILKVLNGVFPITNYMIAIQNALLSEEILLIIKEVAANEIKLLSMESLTMAYMGLAGSQALSHALMFSMVYLTRKFAADSPAWAAAIGMLTGAFLGLSLALQLVKAGLQLNAAQFIGLAVGGAVVMGLVNLALQDMMKPAELDLSVGDTGDIGAAAYPNVYDTSVADLGLRMYDTGGLGGRHFPVMVEPGETVTSKTQNMLGNGRGITINIHGDVYDSDNFVEKVAEVLPRSLRRNNDIGGMI